MEALWNGIIYLLYAVGYVVMGVVTCAAFMAAVFTTIERMASRGHPTAFKLAYKREDSTFAITALLGILVGLLWPYTLPTLIVLAAIGWLTTKLKRP